MPKEYWVNVYETTWGETYVGNCYFQPIPRDLSNGFRKLIYRIHVKMKEKKLVKQIKYNWRYEKFDWMS